MSQAIVPEDPRVLSGDFEVVVKVRSEHSNGGMAVIEETIQPGRFVSPHTHENDVWVYVLTAEIGVLVADTMVTAGTGQLGAETTQCRPRDVEFSRGLCPGRRGIDTGRLRALKLVGLLQPKVRVSARRSSTRAAPGPLAGTSRVDRRAVLLA